MTWTMQLQDAARRLAVGCTYAYLMAAPLVVVYYALSPSIVLQWPPEGVTFKWFAAAFGESRLMAGLVTSVLVAGLSSVGAVAVGVPAALGLHRGSIPGRGLLLSIFLSPLTLPGLVLAVGVLMAIVSFVQPLVGTGVVGGTIPLVAVHLLVTVPWTMRTAVAGLETMDRSLEDAARGLGATPFAALWLVTLPVIRPAIMTGALFAFIVSFGNFALSLFFASGRVVTLPIAIYEYVDRFQDPTVAAMSVLVIALTTAAVVTSSLLNERLKASAPRRTA